MQRINIGLSELTTVTLVSVNSLTENGCKKDQWEQIKAQTYTIQQQEILQLLFLST